MIALPGCPVGCPPPGRVNLDLGLPVPLTRRAVSCAVSGGFWRQSQPGSLTDRYLTLRQDTRKCLLREVPPRPSWLERRRQIINPYAAATAGTGLTILRVEGENHVGPLARGFTHWRDEVVAAVAVAGVSY